MLKNPCYAGTFAYGKTAARTRIEEGRARQSSRYRKPQNEWKVLLVGHHPGYISWEEYLETQQRLEANVAMYEGEGSGAAKLGATHGFRHRLIPEIGDGRLLLGNDRESRGSPPARLTYRGQ